MRAGLLLIIVAAVTLEATSLIQFFYAQKGLRSEATLRAETELEITNNRILDIINQAETAVHNSEWIAKWCLDYPDSLVRVATRLVRDNQVIMGSTVALVPGYLDRHQLFAPYAYEDTDGRLAITSLATPEYDYPEREWPNKEIEKAPIWCSVDLRDGNQALIDPMNLQEKLEFFHALVDMGFKEIEIGFPSASETEYEICRELIEKNHIPDDVTIQVLVQAREHLIRKTFEAIKGAKNVIVHFYNSTSTLQRKVVFKTDMQGVIDIAVEGARLIKKLTDEYTGDTNIRFEYSPESFSGTEPDNAVAICDRVMEELGSTKENPVILNLPNTVEMCTPNTYADQIEYFIRHLKNREAAIISVHPHNDRGCGVAAGELALLAGAERVEGTLFGNGERTGNMDIVTMGLNMFTQGVDPKLDFSDLPRLRDIYERCTNMKVDPRQPYIGELVFTAFSGSHQDAINKGHQYMRDSGTEYWEIPYLPIDPADVGREYEPIIRINSQSGKGGAAFVMSNTFSRSWFRQSVRRSNVSLSRRSCLRCLRTTTSSIPRSTR